MQDNEKKTVLSVEGLNVYYKKQKGLFGKAIRKAYVKNASFTVNEGEIIGLVGESGCGKSTLAKAILGVVKDTDGIIRHYSDNPQMIFQDPFGSLNPSKKIAWILSEPLRIRGGMSEEEMHKKAVEMLQRVGLGPQYADRKPRELSGGQRQRVCIALSLMLGPKLIIADEPVSALDVTVQDQILRLLLKLNKELNIAIIFISHDLKVVYEICDRVMVMKDGVILEQGTDNDIYLNPKEDYTKLLLESAGLR